MIYRAQGCKHAQAHAVVRGIVGILCETVGKLASLSTNIMHNTRQSIIDWSLCGQNERLLWGLVPSSRRSGPFITTTKLSLLITLQSV